MSNFNEHVRWGIVVEDYLSLPHNCRFTSHGRTKFNGAAL